MEELYNIWQPAASLADLPPVPPLSDFAECYEDIDIGYDCFISDCLAWGPYALQYDEESFGRDRWGWSANVWYEDGGRSTYAMPAHKMGSAAEAYNALCEWRASL